MTEIPLSLSIDQFDRIMLIDDGDCKTYSIGYSRLGKRRLMVVTLTKCVDGGGKIRIYTLNAKDAQHAYSRIAKLISRETESSYRR
ncbi:MAG: hypothetical protein RXQ96_01365 [Thermocladium sp.]|jgi:hypothetical protein|nr:MAG: hypothetical protein AT710_04470 [Thermocladium sp. ECH_B]